MKLLSSVRVVWMGLALCRPAILMGAADAGQAAYAQGTAAAVTVTDNGTGIPSGSRRSGLRNLAARAAELGGELRLSPAEPAAPRPGTRLEWRVPVAAAAT